MKRKIGGVISWSLNLPVVSHRTRVSVPEKQSVGIEVHYRPSRPKTRRMHSFTRLLNALLLCCMATGSPGGCAGNLPQDGVLGSLLSYLNSGYELPPTYVLPEAAIVRVTQHGVDQLTDELKSIVNLLFTVDDQGRIQIPLGDFIQTIPFADFDAGSLGSFKTTLDVSSLVLTLDWSGLQLQLVDKDGAGASVLISMNGAKLGVLSGEITGTADYSILGVSGTQAVACGIANGLGDPADAIAEVGFSAWVHIGIDDSGNLILTTDVLSLSIDALDLGVTTPCEAAVCATGDDITDALFDTPCDKCALICDALDTLSGATLPGLVALLQDQAINPLLVSAINTLANGLAEQLLGGMKLLFGGEIEVQTLLDTFLPSLSPLFPGLQNLGFSLGPSSQPFEVEDNGLNLVLRGGLAPTVPHVCTSFATTEPDFAAMPQGGVPKLDGMLATPVGPMSYDLAAAVPQRFVNELLWGVFRTGALCIRVDSIQIEELFGLSLSSSVMDLLLPGLRRLVGDNAPLLIVLEPGIQATDLPLVRFGTAPQIRVTLPNTGVSLYVETAYRTTRLFSVTTDVDVFANVVLTGPNILELALVDLKLGTPIVTYNELAPHANLQAIVPFVVEVGMSVLLGGLDSFSLDISPLLSGATDSLGFPFIPIVENIQPAGQSTLTPDWLALYLRLNPKMESGLLYQCHTSARISDDLATSDPSEIKLDVAGCGDLGEFQWRVNGTLWRDFAPGPTLSIRHPALLLPGKHRIDIRGRKPGQWRTLDPSYVTVYVGHGPGLAQPPMPFFADPLTRDTSNGCATSPWSISAFVVVGSLMILRIVYLTYMSRRPSQRERRNARGEM